MVTLDVAMAYRDELTDPWTEMARSVEQRKLQCTFPAPKVSSPNTRQSMKSNVVLLSGKVLPTLLLYDIILLNSPRRGVAHPGEIDCGVFSICRNGADVCQLCGISRQWALTHHSSWPDLKSWPPPKIKILRRFNLFK